MKAKERRLAIGSGHDDVKATGRGATHQAMEMYCAHKVRNKSSPDEANEGGFSQMGPMTHPVSLAPLLFRRCVVASRGGLVRLALGGGGGGERTGAESRGGHGTGDGSGVGIGIACMCREWIGGMLWC